MTDVNHSEAAAHAKTPRFWRLRKLILLAMAVIAVYLAFRDDPSFATIPWFPRGVVCFLQTPVELRNFWGFLPLGVYLGAFLRVRPVPRVLGVWQGPVVFWLLLPILKELLQIPFPNRHCNLVGMVTGVGGMTLGLTVGTVMRLVMKRRPRPVGPERPLP